MPHLVTVAVRHDDASQLIGQPGDAEGRCNDHTHPGDFASRLLLCRCSTPNASLYACLHSKCKQRINQRNVAAETK